MEALLAFYFGWRMGVRSGPAGESELNDAIARLRESEEFAAVVEALRGHAGEILRQVATHVESADNDLQRTDVLASVYELIFNNDKKARGD
jgi:hypothetical protein